MKFVRINHYIILAHIILLLLQLLFWNFIIDDAFITFRYANNFYQYNQLVFNVNETPVEGYSNFLWVMWIAIGFNLKLDPLLFSKISGMLFCHLNIFILYKLTFLLNRSKEFSNKVVIIYALTPNIALWSIGGLETSLFSFLLLLSVYFFLKEIREWNTSNFKISPFFFTLLSLTRHEGIIIFGVTCIFLLIFLIKKKKLPKFKKFIQFLSFIGFYFIFYLPYFFWRIIYYNNLLPHTYVAKQDPLTISLLLNRILFYLPLLFFLLPVLLIIGINLIRNFKKKNYSHTKLYIMLLILVLSGFLILINSWMPGFRFTVPIIPFIYLLLPKSINFLSFFGNAYRIDPFLSKNIKRLTILIICLSNFLLIFTFYPMIHFYGIGIRDCNIILGKWIHESTSQNASLAIWDAGAIPFYAEIRTIDTYPESLQDLYIYNHPKDADYILNQNITILILNEKYFEYIKSDARFITNYNLIFFAQLFYADGILGLDYIYQIYLLKSYYISNSSISELLNSSPRFYI